MGIASGAKAIVAFETEATRGVNPGGTAGIAPRLTERAAPVLEAAEITSNEVTVDRQQSSAAQGARSVSGQWGFELAYESIETPLEVMMNDTFAEALAAEGTRSTSASGTNLSVTTTADVRVGHVFRISSVTGAFNHLVVVTAVVDATNLTIASVKDLNSPAVAITDVADVAVAQMSDCRITGSDLVTLTVERQFPDADLYQIYTGVALNDFSLSVAPESIVSGTFSVVGMAAGAITGTGTKQFTSLTTEGAGNNAYSPFGAVIWTGTQTAACATAIELNVGNNRSTAVCLSSKTSPDVFEGVAEVSGSVTFLFEDQTEYNQFIAESINPISIVFTSDQDDEFTAFCMEQCLFTGTSSEVPSTGPVRLSLNFRSIQASGGTSLSVCKGGGPLA